MANEIPLALEDYFGKHTARLRFTLGADRGRLSIPIFTAAAVGANPRSPSGVFLKALEKAESKLDSRIEVSDYHGDEEVDFEDNVKRFVESHVDHTVHGVSLELNKDGRISVRVEIEVPDSNGGAGISEDVISAFSDKIANNLAGVTVDDVKIIEFNLRTPTSYVVLSTIRKNQPVQLNNLRCLLNKSGYEVPESGRWLERRLDKLRKSDLILWDNGEYTLTKKGIDFMPATSGNEAPDVERALALGRRFSDNRG